METTYKNLYAILITNQIRNPRRAIMARRGELKGSYLIDR